MSLILKSRVKEHVTVTGTGNVTLGGAVAGYQTFASVMANGDLTWYDIVDSVANAWESGQGTWNTGNTLSRSVVFESSNSGSLVNFAGNACDVFIGLPVSAVPLRLQGSAIGANAKLGTLPANGTILDAIIRETAGHSVNVSFGTTSGGTDITSAAIAVPASGATMVSILSFGAVWFSASATQDVFVSSTSWGLASVNVILEYRVAL